MDAHGIEFDVSLCLLGCCWGEHYIPTPHALDSARVTLPLHAIANFGDNEPTHFSSLPPGLPYGPHRPTLLPPLLNTVPPGLITLPAHPLINLSVYDLPRLSKYILPYLFSFGFGAVAWAWDPVRAWDQV